MRMYRLFVLLIVVLIVNSCGKPTDPETLKTYESAGYKLVSRFPTTAFTQDVLVRDTLAYIAQGEGGLVIVNISDQENPELISITSEYVRGYSTKISMKENTVYLAAGSFGVNVLNVENPLQPIITSSNLSIKPAKSFHIMGDYMFTAISEQGVNVSEISNANQPEIRGDTKTSGYAKGVVTTADSTYLLVACGEMGLTKHNISNFQEGYGTYPLIGWGDTPGYAEAIVINDELSLAFIACGTEGLQIVNYSDSSDMHVVGSFDGGGYARDLILKDDLVFMATGQRGLQIIDISDFTSPYLIGSISTEYALGLDIDENFIYIADEMEGMVIISRPE